MQNQRFLGILIATRVGFDRLLAEAFFCGHDGVDRDPSQARKWLDRSIAPSKEIAGQNGDSPNTVRGCRYPVKRLGFIHGAQIVPGSSCLNVANGKTSRSNFEAQRL